MAPPRAPAPQRGYPGELGYTVRVDPDDGPTVEASYADGTMTDDVRGLVTWIQEHPRATPSR